MFAAFKQFSRKIAQIAFGLLLIANIDLAQSNGRLFQETILEGGSYAKRITLPAAFLAPGVRVYRSLDPVAGYVHHVYARDPSSADGLLVTAQPILLEGHSPTIFAIRPTGGVRQSTSWTNTLALSDQDLWLRGIRARPIKSSKGFQLEGHLYSVRGQSEDNCGLGFSEDKRLVFTGCRYNSIFSFDIFDGFSRQRLAAIDLRFKKEDDQISQITRYIEFLDNRWLAISLDKDLRKILLFDFEPHFKGTK